MFDTVRLRILLVALSAWVNRQQRDVIEHLREENRVLNEHVAGRRVKLTDATPLPTGSYHLNLTIPPHRSALTLSALRSVMLTAAGSSGAAARGAGATDPCGS